MYDICPGAVTSSTILRDTNPGHRYEECLWECTCQRTIMHTPGAPEPVAQNGIIGNGTHTMRPQGWVFEVTTGVVRATACAAIHIEEVHTPPEGF